MEKLKETAEQLLANALIYYQQSERIKTKENWLHTDEETVEIALKAIDEGAELNGRLDYPFGGDVPYLQVATDKQIWSLAEKMIDKGADVNEEDWQGANCFHNLFFHYYYFDTCQNREAARAVMVKMLQHGAMTESTAKMIKGDQDGKKLLTELIEAATIQK